MVYYSNDGEHVNGAISFETHPFQKTLVKLEVTNEANFTPA